MKSTMHRLSCMMSKKPFTPIKDPHQDDSTKDRGAHLGLECSLVEVVVNLSGAVPTVVLTQLINEQVNEPNAGFAVQRFTMWQSALRDSC